MPGLEVCGQRCAAEGFADQVQLGVVPAGAYGRRVGQRCPALVLCVALLALELAVRVVETTPAKREGQRAHSLDELVELVVAMPGDELPRWAADRAGVMHPDDAPQLVDLEPGGDRQAGRVDDRFVQVAFGHTVGRPEIRVLRDSPLRIDLSEQATARVVGGELLDDRAARRAVGEGGCRMANPA